jgi:hypothetical protein
MVHKSSTINKKDSTATYIDKSTQAIVTDSSYNVITKETETADLVIILKDSAEGMVSFSNGDYDLPAKAIKEIRIKKKKTKDHQDTGSKVKSEAIVNDKKLTVETHSKVIQKEKKVFKVRWFMIVFAISLILLYIYRKKIYEFFKGFIK